jgi:hypothetical protein
VFGPNYIRELAEQNRILDRRCEALGIRIPKRIGQLVIDKDRGGVTIGRKFVPLVDLVAAVAILRK